MIDLDLTSILLFFFSLMQKPLQPSRQRWTFCSLQGGYRFLSSIFAVKKNNFHPLLCHLLKSRRVIQGSSQML